MTTEDTGQLRFTADHCWARREADGTVTVGLTDFAQGALGAIVFAGLPESGSQIAAGDVLGELESTKAVSEVYAPVGGVVATVNAALGDAPGTINVDPYEAGWICGITPSDPGEYDGLLTRVEYDELTDIEPEDEPSTKD